MTLWEGGVRGVGFVHSNLIRKKGRVSNDLIDATDWLPTFYHLAGGNVSMVEDKIDGMNVWDTLANGKKSPRTEVRMNSISLKQNCFTQKINTISIPRSASFIVLWIYLTIRIRARDFPS